MWDPLRPSRTETLHLRLTLLIMGLRHKYICISKFIHVQICICIYRKEVGILYLAFSVERKKDDSIVKKLISKICKSNLLTSSLQTRVN